MSHAGAPAWSPDGARIAFKRFVEGGSSDIHVMHADGSSVVNLTNSPATEVAPVWSPDGTEIAFSSDASDGLPVIHRMNADGTNVHRIGGHPTIHFDWSPEGTFFCFVAVADGQQDLFIMPADGGTITNVTNDGLSEQKLFNSTADEVADPRLGYGHERVASARCPRRRCRPPG